MTRSHHRQLPASLLPRRDYGQLIARFFCVIFGLIGLIPLAAGLLTRWAPVRDWAARETARALHDQIGLEAEYQVQISLWPLGLELESVTLASSDGGPPALVAPRVSLRPRLFSLLGGRIDAGQIVVDAPSIRVVLKDGELANLKLALPADDGATQLPIVSVAITDAHIAADIDGFLIESDAIDLDVFAEAQNSVEIALRAAVTSLTQKRTLDKGAPAGTGGVAIDDDVICQLDARVRYDSGALLVRRLSLLGVVDASPDAATEPSCELERVRTDPRRVLARLSGVRVELGGGATLEQVTGHVLLQAPLELSSRYLKTLPLAGWVQVSGELDVNQRSTLPEFHGKVRTGHIELGPYTLAAHVDAELHLIRDKLLVSTFRAGYADGDVLIEDASIDLLAPGIPLHVRSTEGTGLTFPGLMRDVDVTPNTIVQWDINRVSIQDFQGTINPPKLEGHLNAETQRFEVFDRSVHDRAKRHMIGVPRAKLTGTFGVHSDSVRFEGMRADFGKSRLHTSVRIGFDNSIQLVVPEGGVIDLADVSPLVDIPMSGQARFAVEMNGKMGDPVLTGSLGVSDLWFAGFPLGNLSTESLRFVPLVIDVENAVLTNGKSEYRLGAVRVDFDTDATLAASALVKDSRIDLRDFLAMWLFDADPRWDNISGSGSVKGRVSYVLGGASDPCKGGNLRVRGDVDLGTLHMFGENYDTVSASLDFNWFDVEASYLGMRLDVPSVVLHKGSGTLLGSLRLSKGAEVQGQLVASLVPLSELQGLGPLSKRALGTIGADAEVRGTLDALSAKVQARISPIRIGRSELPASSLFVTLTPVEQKPTWLGSTACGAPKPGKFDRAEFDADHPSGVFKATGSLFGGQVQLAGFEITRQQAKHVRGKVDFHNLDLVALSNLAPEASLIESNPTGVLDATLVLQDLALEEPLAATGTLDLARLSIDLGSAHIDSVDPKQIRLQNGSLDIPALTLRATTQSGQTASFNLGGRLSGLGAAKPNIDVRFTLEPTPLDGFVGLIPAAERARGTLGGQIAVKGPLDAPVYRGGLQLTDGAISLRGSPQSITELDLKLGIAPGEIIIEQGDFSFGGGRVQLRGNAPLTGFRLGELRTFITARNVTLPVAPGIRATADAELRARWQPGAITTDRKQALPQLVGNVVLSSFNYTRPIKMTANITDLAQRGRRTEFESYQPEADMVSFDVNVRSTKPLKLQNNLIDASLTIEDEVLQIAGTNQRFGIRGALRVTPGGRFRLTRNEFEIQQGRVRFDDPTRIAPLVDVTAVTDFKRSGGSIDAPSTSTQTSAAAGSDFRVTMHAHGDAETLKIDLTSEPQLAQDDIFLLLTLGITRAELDQAQSSSLGESMALEALGALTGADQVVTQAIPVIDEFRIESFSTRAGRTEPAITIGKRLSDRIRAYVTSAIAETRDVRSNVEVKINRKVSVEASYDNMNDITSSTLGNLGADIRWRLDFE